jgi:hypothetical protein
MELKGTSAHQNALKFQLNEARSPVLDNTNGKGKKLFLAQRTNPVGQGKGFGLLWEARVAVFSSPGRNGPPRCG